MKLHRNCSADMKTLAVFVLAASAAYAQPAKTITSAECTAGKLGSAIPPSAIGEKVSEVMLDAPQWHDAANGLPAYCSINGGVVAVDSAAPRIRFGVAFPASWQGRATQLGGGGMNGVIPPLTGSPTRGTASFLSRGFATYGSDSGHQMSGGFGRRGPAPPPDPHANDWTLNPEAIANLGYLQLKKTHDAAIVLIQRMYGERPRYNYFFGTSQGGREALTVAQRYPNDYDGIAAEVPIVSFSSLMLAPELVRIQEKPIANWVTPAKVNAIRGEFMRQCDKLDGLEDGIMNNYPACRALFDVKQGAPNRHPWAAKRCPNNADPDPKDTSATACLTDGQISTLEMVYSRYPFATPLANGVKSFGMWLPNTDPSGSGLILPIRFRGQEGATSDAPMHSHLGVLGVTGFLMRNLAANPLDYAEGGALNQRRMALSAILDSTDPDLSAFHKRGGKLIVVIGTNDTLASPGAQLDYYQSVLDRMGRETVDLFARFYVLPQTNHGLMGNAYGQPAGHAVPNVYDRFGLITEWVEKGTAPGKSVTVTAAERSLPMCSYPDFPKYRSGPPENAASYICSAR
ncbi:MAG: tannase/feruloyl esterase family alpha/beta hydrolase [Acidobacteriota bacterium]|nr:tannase/feruloyl esterase family alpha/beta hydrolase [Acidobacteriota bacterium]